MSYSTQYNPLTKTQKAALSQLARTAFDYLYDLDLIDAPGDTKAKQFTNWRRKEQFEAVEQASLTDCAQKDYLPLRAHFNNLLGRSDKAFEDTLKSLPANDHANQDDTTESRAKKIHLIKDAIAGTKFHLNYVLAIAKNKFRKPKLKHLEDLPTEQLHQLLITTKERIRKAKPTPQQPDPFTTALANVDWHYQYANGQAYLKGKASYDLAHSLATTPEQQALFNQRRSEKLGH